MAKKMDVQHRDHKKESTIYLCLPIYHSIVSKSSVAEVVTLSPCVMASISSCVKCVKATQCPGAN